MKEAFGGDSDDDGNKAASGGAPALPPISDSDGEGGSNDQVGFIFIFMNSYEQLIFT